MSLYVLSQNIVDTQRAKALCFNSALTVSMTACWRWVLSMSTVFSTFFGTVLKTPW